MKLGIMQPYFFPYIGYWQLMNYVDTYVVYDDVNFIKGGWINRNRILLNGQIRYVNLPMKGISPNKRILEVTVNDSKKEIEHTLNVIKEAYKKAPYFADTFQLINEVFKSEETSASGFIFDSFRVICKYLGITTKLVLSSDISKEASLSGENRVIDICEKLGADEYINPIGGLNLYDWKHFKSKNIELAFIRMKDIEYPQFGSEFVPNLSVIDAMMFNSRENVRKMLNEYNIIRREVG